jgi:hypothetical protein
MKTNENFFTNNTLFNQTLNTKFKKTNQNNTNNTNKLNSIPFDNLREYETM